MDMPSAYSAPRRSLPAPAADNGADSVPPDQLSKPGPYLSTIVKDTVESIRGTDTPGVTRAVRLPVVATCPCVAVPSHAILGADAVTSHPTLCCGGNGDGAGSGSGSGAGNGNGNGAGSGASLVAAARTAAAAAAAHVPQQPAGPPFPVCVLFNGFQVGVAVVGEAAASLRSTCALACAASPTSFKLPACSSCLAAQGRSELHTSPPLAP